jgi:hypothetical protein
MTVPDEPVPLRKGVLVRIRGLTSGAGLELNGLLGRCEIFDPKSGRWGITIHDGSLKAIKAGNLFSFDEYLRVAQGGIRPLDMSQFMEDFATNPKYEILPQEKRDDYSSKKKVVALARKASPPPTKAEEMSGKLSPFVVKEVELQAGSLKFAVIASPEPIPQTALEPMTPKSQEAASPVHFYMGDSPDKAARVRHFNIGETFEEVRKRCPTIVAVSRGGQQHVAKLSRLLRAELHGWQLIVAMRPEGSPDLYEPAGTTLLQQFLEALLVRDDLTPFAVLSDVFHLLGMSNGGAAVLALAAKVPTLVASLTLVTGYIPQLTDVQALRIISPIHFYVGDNDEMGHEDELRNARAEILSAGGTAHLHIVKGAGHFDITEHLNLKTFWGRFEAAR